MELDAEVVINRRDVGDISSIITCTGVALHADPSDTGTFGSTNKSRVSTQRYNCCHLKVGIEPVEL